MSVIEIENLTKDFQVGFWRKRAVRALDGLTLRVEAGEVFGFLGPNGAGKTTTLKLLMNLIRPTAGKAMILGEPVGSVSMKRRIGYLPENPYFYDYLTPEEFLFYVGSLFGLRGVQLANKVERLLRQVGLTEARRTPLRKFSKGMVQRIGIAQAVINDPELLFLDEPMSGLDPLGRREVREVILSLKSKGVTIFFSSHILPDVEAICDRVAILNRGTLRQVGSLSEILKVPIEIYEIILNRIEHLQIETLRKWCAEITQLGDRLHLRVQSSDGVREAISLAIASGAEIVSVNPVRPSLEDHFLTEVLKA